MTVAAVDRWVTHGSIRIHCLDWGGPVDGPVVLLLHGVGGNALIWNDVAPLLRAGLPGHRLVAVDTRDGGRTDHPATGYGLSEFIADVLAVADDLGAARVSMVGHSRGGWLAACIGALHPDRVDRLVLLDPARITFGTPAEGDAAYGWIFGNLGPFASREAAVEWARAAEPTAHWTATRTGAFLDNLVDRPDGTVAGRLPRGAMEQLRAVRADGETIRYQDVSAPTLLIVATGLGEKHAADRLVYAERITGTRVARVFGTHFLHTDAPEDVAALVVDHLGG